MYRLLDKIVGYGVLLLQVGASAWILSWMAFNDGIPIGRGMYEAISILMYLFVGVKFAAGRLDGQIILVLLQLPASLFWLCFPGYFTDPAFSAWHRVVVIEMFITGLYALLRLVHTIRERRSGTAVSTHEGDA